VLPLRNIVQEKADNLSETSFLFVLDRIVFTWSFH